MDRKEYTLGPDGRWLEPTSGLAPPHFCPECGSELDQPRSRAPARVKVWGVGAVLFTFLALSLLNLFSDRITALVREDVAVVLLLLAINLPAVAAAVIERRAGRVIPLECYRCGWRKDYRIADRRTYDIPHRERDGRGGAPF